MIPTRLGVEMDEAALVKREGYVEDDDAVIQTVEYCLPDCAGPAHASGVPDQAGHFCNQHVHRSVHVQMKRWPAGFVGAVPGAFGG